MAGTANDYMGKLIKTRSGRACISWPIPPPKPEESRARTIRSAIQDPEELRSYYRLIQRSPQPPKRPGLPFSPKLVAIAGHEIFNDSRYPDGSALNASNYCRNPSRNIGGTWCYTADPSVPRDLCNVRDCDKPGKYWIIDNGKRIKRKVYFYWLYLSVYSDRYNDWLLQKFFFVFLLYRFYLSI